MNRVLKKVLLIAAIIACTIGLVWGILTIVRSARREAVNVYAVSDFITTDSWESASKSSGVVTTDKLQKITLSSTQTVTAIYVEEGQQVHKGDKLLSYDTTLSQLDVQLAQIQLEREELELKGLKKSLTALENAKDTLTLQMEKSILQSVIDRLQEAGKADDTAAEASVIGLIQNGTEEQPYYIRDTAIDPAAVPGDSHTDRYVVLYTIESGTISVTQGVILKADGTIGFFAPDSITLPVAEGNPAIELSVWLAQKRMEKLEEDLAGAHTRQELLKLQQDMREQITAAEIDLKLAALDLQRKQNEIEDGVIYSQLDGTVKVVRNEEDAFRNSTPIIEVSGGGGYYVSGVINELELGNVHIGDTVQINSWMTGTNCEGTIVSLEEYPSEESGWGGGNSNVSYYPFQAFVSEEANLQENDYVDITYQSNDNRDNFYLDNMFIRTENGKSYVYVRGESGTLEQRWITIGADLWGCYTEIRSGLSQEDYIAFPYGKDVTDGAKTQEAASDQLYSY